MNLVKRILVATDFSVAAQHAVTRAALVARQHEADLYLLHALPDWELFSRWTAARREHYQAVTQHAQRALAGEVNRVLDVYGIHAHAETQLGRASEVIRQGIHSYQPDLVVLGARGEHEPRVAPAALGGTALKTLLHIDRPLLLVREEHIRPYQTVMAAIHEPSPEAQRVLLWAISAAPAGDCHIVHAFDAPYCERLRVCGPDSATLDACVQSTEAIARRGFDTLLSTAGADARAHLHLVRGYPLGVLVTEIARYAPELLVVGRSDNGTFGLRMTYHTPIDVLVVPVGGQ